jgi:hypothetical protein
MAPGFVLAFQLGQFLLLFMLVSYEIETLGLLGKADLAWRHLPLLDHAIGQSRSHFNGVGRIANRRNSISSLHRNFLGRMVRMNRDSIWNAAFLNRV